MVSALAGLGRLAQKDDRNTHYALPLIGVPPTIRHRYWSGAEVLDQGDTPQCVGYAGFGWLRGGPVINKPPFTPTELYHMAQEYDEWPGTDYDGSSTLGLMKALKAKGYIGEYRWAYDAQTLVAWLLNKGPVLVGTNWYMDMFTPNVHNGFMEVSGTLAGGHEWRIIGADLDKHCPDASIGAVRMVNSWGYGWADHGRAWLSIKDLDKLIKDNGEAVTALEIKL